MEKIHAFSIFYREGRDTEAKSTRLTPKYMKQENTKIKWLAALMLLALVAVPSRADVTIDQLNFTLNADGTGYTVKKYNNNLIGRLEIPAEYNGRPVVGIDEEAFYNCYQITSVVIPNTISRVGDMAFGGCTALEAVNIPNSISIIGNRVFYNCHFAEISIPTSIVSIGCEAFRFCTNLRSVVIPNSVTSIGDKAFFGCDKLASVNIAASVQSIGESSFGSCNDLRHIVVDEANTVYDSRDNCNAIIETKTNTLIAGCNYSHIPSSVTSIGNYAFHNFMNLKKVLLPSTLETIGRNAFAACGSLADVDFPTSLKAIEDSAFIECPLDNIILPSSLETIGTRAFSYCKISDITVPASVTSIDIAAFSACSNLKSIIVENGNNVYDSRENCNAIIETNSNTLICGCKDSDIPSSITSIGESAFEYSGITEITIPINVTSIGEKAFNTCGNLKNIVLPNSLTAIGDYAFNRCNSITEVVIPNSVLTIGVRTFARCGKLEKVVIGSSINFMDNVFNNCQLLTSITSFNTTPPVINNVCFKNYNATLYVPSSAIDAYNQAENWSMFSNIIGLSSSIDGIADGSENGIDYSAPYEVYNIAGARIGCSIDGLAPAIYIVRQGSKSAKVIK